MVSESIFLIYICAGFESGMLRLTAEVEDWLETKNVRNMLRYYKKALLVLKNGGCIVDSVPTGTRKRLMEYGVIRRFGNRFELTKLGNELI